MSKYMSARSLSGDLKTILDALACLKSQAEISQFLRDLLTESEIREIAARWKAAQMLDKSRPYTEVSEVTGLSSTTVARVSKWLKKGAGGYRLVLNRMRRQ